MPEHRAQERIHERATVESHAEAERAAELPGRRGRFGPMAAEMPRPSAAKEVMEDIGAGMTRLAQETTRGWRAAMMLPLAPSAGFAELQAAMAELMTSTLRNNIRLTQDLMRLYNPQDHAAFLQKLMRQWLDAASESQATMLRLLRQDGEASQPPAEGEAPRRTTH